MTTTPEHHQDGARIMPTEVPTAIYPGDENDRLPGETEADREERLRQLGVQREQDGTERRDLQAEWSEQQDDTAGA